MDDWIGLFYMHELLDWTARMDEWIHMTSTQSDVLNVATLIHASECT